jgi:formate dehydrogenase maturation protein FdhE
MARIGAAMSTDAGMKVVEAARTLCPDCGSDDIFPYKSVPHGEKVKRYTQCRGCGAKFFVIDVPRSNRLEKPPADDRCTQQ